MSTDDNMAISGKIIPHVDGLVSRPSSYAFQITVNNLEYYISIPRVVLLELLKEDIVSIALNLGKGINEVEIQIPSQKIIEALI